MSSEQESKLCELPASTTRLLGSTQVITSVFSVVKELVENCLDAGASTVDVKLENYGFDKIEVRDNGSGIPSIEVPYVTKRFHTSKISAFSDLEHLCTYGFRGEALGSLCTVSKLSITTRTSSDDISLTYVFNKEGQMTSSKPSHLGQGTTITAVDLFSNVPVRRQYYNTTKKKKEELKKVEDLLFAFGIINPGVRLSLRHNKDLIWQKNVLPDIKSAVCCVLGRNVFNNLQHEVISESGSKIDIELYIPRPDGDVQYIGRSNPDKSYTFINKRPVKMKDLEKLYRGVQFFDDGGNYSVSEKTTYLGKGSDKFSHTRICPEPDFNPTCRRLELVRQYYVNRFPSESSRYPVFCVSVVLPATELDVNVDPNKTTVFLHHKDTVLESISNKLERVYGPKDKPSSSSKSQKEAITADISDDINGALNKGGISNLSKQNGYSEGFNSHLNENGAKILQVDPSDFSVVSSDIPTFKINLLENDSGSVDSSILKTSVLEKLEDSEATSHPYDRSSVNGNDGELRTPSGDSNKEMLDLESENGGLQTPLGDSNKEMSDLQSEEMIPPSQKPVFDICENFLCKEVDENSEKSNSANLEVLDSERIRSTLTSDKDSFLEIFSSWGSDDEMKVDQNNEQHNLASESSTKLVEKENGDTDKANQVVPSVGELWSKGYTVLGTGSDSIQPVTLLNAGKRPLSSPVESPPLKKRHLSSEFDQPKIFDLVSNKPVKRDESGYIKFSKEIRPKVIDENQDADYSEITRIVEQQWEELTEREKQKYETVNTPPKHKEKVNLNKSTKQLSNKMKQKQIQPGLSIKDHLLAAAVKKSTVDVITKIIPFSLKGLQNIYRNRPNDSQVCDSKKFQLIGQLKSCGMWCCCHGNEIQILNHHRIQETILYHKLMSNHILQYQQLETPIVLSESNVGGPELWQVLKTMATKEQTCSTYSYIGDQRLIGNGINIKYHIGKESEDLHAEVTGLCNIIPTYGLSDLVEILELIANTNADNLSKSRPLKVINYLQGEAVRMARQLPRQQTADEIEDLMEQIITDLPSECHTCLHNKPFYYKLYDTNDIPLTQTQE